MLNSSFTITKAPKRRNVWGLFMVLVQLGYYAHVAMSPSRKN